MERAKDSGTSLSESDRPARYRIEVRGMVGNRWTEWFGGLTVVAVPGDPPRTALTGAVADQAALLGVLGALVTLRCTLLLVERLPDESAESPNHTWRNER